MTCVLFSWLTHVANISSTRVRFKPVPHDSFIFNAEKRKRILHLLGTTIDGATKAHDMWRSKPAKSGTNRSSISGRLTGGGVMCACTKLCNSYSLWRTFLLAHVGNMNLAKIRCQPSPHDPFSCLSV